MNLWLPLTFLLVSGSLVAVLANSWFIIQQHQQFSSFVDVKGELDDMIRDMKQTNRVVSDLRWRIDHERSLWADHITDVDRVARLQIEVEARAIQRLTGGGTKP